MPGEEPMRLPQQHQPFLGAQGARGKLKGQATFP
jgi:hypothetical protein